MCFRSTHWMYQSLLFPKLLNISKVWLIIFVLRCYTIWMKWETTCVWSSHSGNSAWPAPTSQMRWTPSCTADRTIHTCISQLSVQSIHAAKGAQGGRPSPHTHRGQCLAAAICLECSFFFTALSFVLLLKKKTILKHLWKHLLAITHMTRLHKNCCITLKLMGGVKISTAFNITINLVHLYSGTQHWRKMTTWTSTVKEIFFHTFFMYFVSIFRQFLQKLFLLLIN